MGFTAIWISPVNAQLPGNTADTMSYHGYWPQDLYKLNDAFGTESDLLELSNILHSRGMYLMVDIVANHMAINSNYTDVNYSVFSPFDDSSYFHLPYCNVEHEGASRIDCWLGDDVVPLVDLKTEDENVQSIFNDWISELTEKYSIDGLRLDSAGNINPGFFTSFCESAGVFCMGEVYSGDSDYVCPYQEVMDSTLNYPIYWALTRAFSSSDGSLQDLAKEMKTMQYGCKDSTILGSFSENHDVPRFASHTDDMALAKNVLVYTMLADGVPIVYQGQEQHLNGGKNPLNREALWLSEFNTKSPLYELATTLNLLRSRAIDVASNYSTYQNWVIYNDTSTLVTRKGYEGNQIVKILTNEGSDGRIRAISLDPEASGFVAGETITDVLSCTNLTTNGTGWLELNIKAGQPQALYSADNLAGTNICASGPSRSGDPVRGSATPTGTKSSAFSCRYQSDSVYYVLASLVGLTAVQYTF